ncbi:MAG: hypothetical protein MUF61_01895 [archaeon]|jgi:hypothetical protein|nr:hypothetical protein [archaeon]
MKPLLQSNKKAVSEVVGYVLLIIIALGLSALVFTYMKVIVPKEKVQCPEGISIIVQDYSCVRELGRTTLNLTLSNRGLFNIDGAFIRFGKQEQKIKEQINKGPQFYLYNSTKGIGLPPGGVYSPSFDVNYLVDSTDTYGVEIIPAIMKDNKPVLCETAIISQPIACK